MSNKQSVDARIAPMVDAITAIEELARLTLEQPDLPCNVSSTSMKYRLWFTRQETASGHDVTMRVTDKGSLAAGRLTITESASLMDVAERYRLLADMWDYYMRGQKSGRII